MLRKFFQSRTFHLVLIFGVIMLVAVTPVFATEPKLVTGSKKLFNDAFLWLLGLIPVGAILMFGWHAWMKSMAEDEGAEVAKRNKSMKRVVIYAAIAETASGLVAALLAYFT